MEKQLFGETGNIKWLVDERQGNKTVKELIQDYSDKRIVAGRISETHRRATFFVDENTLSKLDSLCNLMEATTGLDSKYNENMSIKYLKEERLLAKGFRSKLVNFALDSLLSQYESDSGVIPETYRTRFKSSADQTYHRVFMFREDGILHLIEQSNRGVELVHLSSEDTEEDEIIAKYNACVALADK